jgi:hypothetical protein
MKNPALRQLIARFEDPVTLLAFEGAPREPASWEETDIEPQIFSRNG